MREAPISSLVLGAHAERIEAAMGLTGVRVVHANDCGDH